MPGSNGYQIGNDSAAIYFRSAGECGHWQKKVDRMVGFTLTGEHRVRETLPTGQLTNTQWRKSGVKYTNNGEFSLVLLLAHPRTEVFVDVVEEIDAIVDRQGKTITAEVLVRPSGEPHFSNHHHRVVLWSSAVCLVCQTAACPS